MTTNHPSTNSTIGRRLLTIVQTVLVTLFFGTAAHAGFLYTLNQGSSAANQIHGFTVNETTGALTPIAGFPVASGGNGTNTFRSEQMTVDKLNRRLYVINDDSNTLSVFAVNGTTGALTAMPYSPIALGTGAWTTVAVHPTGSPVIVGDATPPGKIVAFNITATTASPSPGSPYTAGAAPALSSTFSRDGYFLYVGGASGQAIAGFSVSHVTGVLTPLPGSPIDSGGANPVAFATDITGRLNTASAGTANQIRLLGTGLAGVPAPASGNPFTSAITAASDGVMSPRELHYFVSDSSGNRVQGFSFTGSLDNPIATAIGAPVDSGGTLLGALAFNGFGNFLFAANSSTRNITTYGVTDFGVLSFVGVQAANSAGTTGRLTGLAYQPNVFTVTNLNDTGVGSLRQAVDDSEDAGGGVVIFSSLFNSPRTISLGSGVISVRQASIVGPGAHLLTVQNVEAGNGVFNSNNGGNDFIGMKITGGQTGTGGGVHANSGTATTIRGCLITQNSGTNGGGVSNVGNMQIIESAIVANSSTVAARGGGIRSSGNLRIVNSTISGNTATIGNDNSGGLNGGGGRIDIVNSTITDNLATGTGAGGGIRLGLSFVRMRNSIVAANLNNTTTPDILSGGAFESHGYNLVGNRGIVILNGPGDQVGTAAAPLNPQLAPIASNGSGVLSHALLPGSPAIDKGSSSNVKTDQRSLRRPQNNGLIPNTEDGSDIGAFESPGTASAPFDFDGDGKTDIGIFRPSLGEWWINRSSNGSTFAAQFGVSSDEIAPGDFTGDGKADIAIWRGSNGVWFILRSEDFSFFSVPFGTNGDAPVPADYDGDGRFDPAVFRPTNATWFISRSSDNGTTIEQFGVVNDRPVPSDFDGDGRTDIAIFRPSNGQWWLNRTTGGVIALTFGASPDRNIPGDYTGDGKSDVAFWRPATGEWFILRSEDFSFFSFPFGTTGDLPASGDYDGDGRYDASVFRPSNSTWFLQFSNGGTLSQQFGVAGDRPVPNSVVP